MGTSHKIVIGFNVIAFLLGMAMAAGAIYLQINSSLYEGLFDATSVWMLGGAGLAMIAVTILGCCSANAGNKGLLSLYLLFIVAIFALQVTGAYYLFVYIGKVSDQNAGAVSTAISDVVDQQINNGVLSIYTKCCSGCPDNACTNPKAADSINSTTLFCPTVGSCEVVAECPESGEVPACFVFLTGDTVETPPYIIDQVVCTGLMAAEFKNGTEAHMLVGPTSEGSCGAGVAKQFQNEVNAFAASYFNWFAIFGAVVAFIQVVLILATLGALCSNDD